MLSNFALILPNDDTSKDEMCWLFTQIGLAGDAVTFGVREFYSPLLTGLPDHAGKEIESLEFTRIRSLIGGGFYPALHEALVVLKDATLGDGVWEGDEGPLMMTNADEDIWIRNNKRWDLEKQRLQIRPYAIKSDTLRENRKLRTAVENVFQAARKDFAGRAANIWKSFP